MTTTTTARELNGRHLLDALKKVVPFSQGLVITTVPRGDLQIAQPAHVSETLLKAYANGYHAEDRLTWQTVLNGRLMRPSDCWNEAEFAATVYHREFLEAAGLRYVVAVPVESPVLEGYPGAAHLCRTADQGDFTRAEVEQLIRFVERGGETPRPTRASRKGGLCAVPSLPFERTVSHLTILDSNLRPLYPRDGGKVDQRLRNGMVEQARRRMQSLNGDAVLADRIQLPDAHGDHRPFRFVAFKHYPALARGPVTMVCLQPDCCEWGVVKPTDFQADPELSRLIPAIKFMQAEFRRGPSLSEISATVTLSPFHFHRRFTELLGLTPKQYLLACQVHDAKIELLAGEKTLADIARDGGFAHQSHFTSRFKQATGLTPTRWRRMAQQRRAASRN